MHRSLGALLLGLALVACGGGGDSAEGFCSRAEAVIDTIDTDEVVVADQIEELADGAPEEIAADLLLIAEFTRQVEAFMAGEEVVDPIDESTVEAASDRVETYLVEECGLDPSEDGSDPGSDPGDDGGAGADDMVGSADDPPDVGDDTAAQELVYALAVSGDIELSHSGDILCTIYEGTIELSFFPESFEWDYGFEATGFDGTEGSYAGVFRIGDGTREASEGPGEITISLGEPDDIGLLVASGSISGSYAGETGSGEFEGTYACEITIEEAAGGSGAVGGGETGAYIDYVISGDAEAERTEVDAVLCGTTEGGFSLSAPSLEAWTIDVMADAATEGSPFEAQFSVSPPSSSDLAEPGPFASRLEGPGTVTYQDAGTDPTGISLYAGTLEAAGLVSEGGFSIDLTAEFTCLGY